MMKYQAAARTHKKLNSNIKKATQYRKKLISHHKSQTKDGYIFMIKHLLINRNILSSSSKNIQ